jgi:hypothetical protein
MTDTRVGNIIIERERRPEDEKPHRCDLPGIFKRFWWDLKLGAVVRCRECNTRYEWKQHTRSTPPIGEFPSTFRAWTRL